MASIILPASPSESRPGRFGVYGGRYVPETLVAALDELEHAYEEGDRAHFEADLDTWRSALARKLAFLSRIGIDVPTRAVA